MFGVRHATLAAVAAASLAASLARPPVEGPAAAAQIPPPTRRPPAPRQPAAQIAKPSPAPSGLIGGRVTAIQTDEGLARARVVVTSPALGERRVVLTGAEGRYTVFELPAGRYTVTASKTGYVADTYGEGGDQPATMIDLADGQQLKTVHFALAREGVVSGRILDEDGTPFEGARVEVLRPQVEQGARVLTVIGRGATDDRGQFRIGGLRAGLHYVSAADPAYDAAGEAASRLDYSPTYHPGVTFPDEAAHVRVEAGRETPGIEFRLRLVRPVRVGGRIAAHDERQLLSGAVIMTSQHGEKLSPIPVTNVTIRPDGGFWFRNVAPGRYVIRARGETERRGVSLFGTFAVSVDRSDLTNITISMTPGAIVDGRLEAEATRGARLMITPSIRVRAVAADGIVFGDALSETIASSGEFVFRGVMPGEHVFRLEGLPDPWVLKAVYWRGRDVADTPIPLESGQGVQNVRVVITDAATTVTGLVRGKNGQPRPNSTVAMFAVNPGLWRSYSRHVRIVRPGLDGTYRIRGLPPGEYWIVATQEIASGDLLDPASLEHLAGRAHHITLAAGESITVDLDVSGALPQTGVAVAWPAAAR